MKKSEITVSMPMTAFEELKQYQNMYQELRDELRSCFNTRLADVSDTKVIEFNAKTALTIAKRTLPIEYDGMYIDICT